MYINAVQRAVSIGGFVGDEIVIAMGDMAQKHQKTLVAGWNRKVRENDKNAFSYNDFRKAGL